MSIMRERLQKVHLAAITLFVGFLCFSGTVYAQQSSSPKYQVNEVFFGTGGTNTCLEWAQNAGKSYCAKQSAGELTIGNTKSNSYQAQAGFNTDRTPWVEIAVQTPSVNVGVLSTTHPNIGTAEFYVKSYLSSGYVVQTWGGPPKNGSRALAAPAAPTPSAPGSEQFGINLTANTGVTGALNGAGTLTENFGVAPVQDPDNTFSFGKANDGSSGGVNQRYDTANNFKYADGDVIAFSGSSSGYTHYTISYLFNITPVTPSGTYTMQQSLVATATF